MIVVRQSNNIYNRGFIIPCSSHAQTCLPCYTAPSSRIPVWSFHLCHLFLFTPHIQSQLSPHSVALCSPVCHILLHPFSEHVLPRSGVSFHTF